MSRLFWKWPKSICQLFVVNCSNMYHLKLAVIKNMNELLPRRGRPRKFENIVLTPLYKNIRQITTAKYKDMMDLLRYTTGAPWLLQIPPAYTKCRWAVNCYVIYIVRRFPELHKWWFSSVVMKYKINWILFFQFEAF